MVARAPRDDDDDDDGDEEKLLGQTRSDGTGTTARERIASGDDEWDERDTARAESTGRTRARDEDASRGTKTIKLAIDGMMCAACVGGVERALRTAKGVSSASVSLIPEGVAVVNYDPEHTGARTLIDAVEEIGFGASVHRGGGDERAKPNRELSKYREDLKMSIALTAPIVLTNLMLERIWSPKVMRGLSFWVFVKCALATRVQFGVGMRFHRGALNSLKRGASNMDVLVSLSTNVAYGVSVFSMLYCLFFGSMFARDYFDTSAMLITFILIGKYLETSARGKTSAAVTKLLELTPRNATLLTPAKDDGEFSEKIIATELIHVGDLLKVFPGARVPADGVVVRGEAFIDESMVSGETMPVTRKVGARVIGGTINEGNTFVIRAEKVGADSTLHQIVHLVENAQLVKAPIQAFADRISNIFVPAVVVLASITFFSWLIAGWVHSFPTCGCRRTKTRPSLQ